jgi:hypothetical protein
MTAKLLLMALARLSDAGPTVAMGVVVAATVGVEVALDVGELLEPHPVIKAIGSIAAKIKEPAISFFTMHLLKFFLEFQIILKSRRVLKARTMPFDHSRPLNGKYGYRWTKTTKRAPLKFFGRRQSGAFLIKMRLSSPDLISFVQRESSPRWEPPPYSWRLRDLFF